MKQIREITKGWDTTGSKTNIEQDFPNKTGNTKQNTETARYAVPDLAAPPKLYTFQFI